MANLCALSVSRAASRPETLATCERAVGVVAHEVEPLVNLARALAATGRTGDAEEVFARAEERFGPRAFTLGHRVGFLLQQRRFEEALEDQRRLLALKPGDEATVRNLIAVLVAAGGEKKRAGDAQAACAMAAELRSLAPGVGAVEKRASLLCPGQGSAQ